MRCSKWFTISEPKTILVGVGGGGGDICPLCPLVPFYHNTKHKESLGIRYHNTQQYINSYSTYILLHNAGLSMTHSVPSSDSDTSAQNSVVYSVDSAGKY